MRGETSGVPLQRTVAKLRTQGYESVYNLKGGMTGWTTDGEMFDSSVARGTPSEFALTEVIAGWTEGLQLMKEGSEHRLWIPEELAYRGAAGRPAGMLVFDVELIAIVD